MDDGLTPSRFRAFTEFGRRRPVDLLGVGVALASLEDLIVANLEWSQHADSALQRRDVDHLVEGSWTSIDRAYLESWVAALGLQSVWEDTLARIGRDHRRA